MSLKITNRIIKLRQRMAEREIESFLVSQPENRYYLSGFDGSAGLLLVTAQDTILATDFRYLEQAGRQAPEYKVFQTKGELEGWLPELIGGLAVKKLGFEAEHISFALHRRLKNTLYNSESRLRLVPVDGLVESLRIIKEPEEIEIISKAVAISDTAMEYIMDSIQAGMSELEIAWQIEKYLHDKGSQSIPFNIIVASGANAALPHARPSEKKVQSGEPILIDLGARVGGYSSDLSRTICLGKADDTFKKVYNSVLRAQRKAIAGIKDGMTCKQADALARASIEKDGYGDLFGHGLGHGLGLATHEQPYLSPNAQDRLANGMVFTIEPGIYLSGWGGVRIEDAVVMENGKVRVLSKAKNRF
jgi:Xaa-Pro aminopeptidase